MSKLVILFLFLSSVAACNDTCDPDEGVKGCSWHFDNAPICTPKATQSCTCNTGGPGHKTCEDGGREFKDCVCDALVDAGVDAEPEPDAE